MAKRFCTAQAWPSPSSLATLHMSTPEQSGSDAKPALRAKPPSARRVEAMTASAAACTSVMCIHLNLRPLNIAVNIIVNSGQAKRSSSALRGEAWTVAPPSALAA